MISGASSTERKHNPYLFDALTGKRYPLGHVLSPPEYDGEWRCDSPHGGNGRQLYLIDTGGIAG